MWLLGIKYRLSSTILQSKVYLHFSNIVMSCSIDWQWMLSLIHRYSLIKSIIVSFRSKTKLRVALIQSTGIKLYTSCIMSLQAVASRMVQLMAGSTTSPTSVRCTRCESRTSSVTLISSSNFLICWERVLWVMFNCRASSEKFLSSATFWKHFNCLSSALIKTILSYWVQRTLASSHEINSAGLP